MDLINGKTVYCPECGKPLEKYEGIIRGKIANVNAYCKNCDKDYHWIAGINKNTKEQGIWLFSEYHKVD